MSSPAISVHDLGKKYQINQGGVRAHYDTLRDRITHGFLNAFRAFANGRSGSEDVNQFIWALRDVSFDVHNGEVVGLIGRNGAGKSTLLKVLSRITVPTEGGARVYGRVGSLLEVGTGFHPELSGRENIYLNGSILGMRRVEIESKFDKIVEFAELEKFVDTPVKFYSSGMYVRLAFAVAAHLEPEILMVDEVLAVGDAAFQKKCMGKMSDVAKEGRTILFVSHNMEAILNLCPRSIVIDSGSVVFDGPSEEAVALYHKTFSTNAVYSEQHILYECEQTEEGEDGYITRVEMLDTSGKPKSIVSTWDDLILRFHYVSREDVRNGSLIADIKDYKQQRLLVFDSGLQIPIQKGNHFVDCIIPRVPLVAGEYYLGVGLSRSNTEWIWRETSLGMLRVQGKDVFSLGRPPIRSRMIFAIPHEWRN